VAGPVLLCVGLSHREVPISVREQVAVSSEELPERLRRLKSIPGVQEAFLVSTCNRLEIFSVAESRTVADDLLREIGPAGAPHAVAPPARPCGRRTMPTSTTS
jgi:glutamyl-tRNA reductase